MNVHSIAVQVPLQQGTRRKASRYGYADRGLDDRGVDVRVAASRCGCSATGSPRTPPPGPSAQVSRLGNPLFNEVIVPMSKKDLWNTLPPAEDKRFARFVEQPELAALLPGALPGRVRQPGRAEQGRRSRGRTWWRSC